MSDRRSKAVTGGATILGVLVAWLGVAAAGGPSPSDRAWELARTLMSPYCPGMTLAACPSPAAADLRGDIARRFERGESRDAIVEALVRRFGDEMRGAPPATGVGWIVWLAPGALALALAITATAAWRGPRTPADDEPSAASTTDERWTQQLRGELERLD